MNSTVPAFLDFAAADALAQLGSEIGRRRLLDDLLEPPLHRAFALEHMDDVSLPVAEHLDFDMARTLDIGLGVDTAVAEIAFRLACRDARRLAQLAHRVNDAHALAAAARSGLDQQRKADRCGLGGEAFGIVFVGDRGRDGDAMRGGEGARGNLVAHQGDRLGVRADEGQARRGGHAGELGVLGQKSIAGMDRVGPRRARGGDDLRAVEMGGYRRLAKNLGRLVGGAHVLGPGLDAVMDGDRGDAELVKGPREAAGDLAPVGDQDLAERRGLLRRAEAGRWLLIHVAVPALRRDRRVRSSRRAAHPLRASVREQRSGSP
jgi:hypothetical protein